MLPSCFGSVSLCRATSELKQHLQERGGRLLRLKGQGSSQNLQAQEIQESYKIHKAFPQSYVSSSNCRDQETL